MQEGGLAMKIFYRDDEAFLAWKRGHPNGLILNEGSPKHMVHKADCGHFKPDNYTERWTEVLKKGFPNGADLRAYMVKAGISSLEECPNCRPEY
jgi:hypothetical protein